MAMEYLAKIGDVVITDADLDRMIAQYPEQNRAYLNSAEGRQRVLEQKIAFTVLGMDAKERGMHRDESFAKAVADFEEQLLAQRAIEDLFANIQISDEDARKYYEICISSFRTDEQVDAKHILVDSEDLANEIREKILSGEVSFEDAAKEYSTCPSKAQGGDLGFFGHGTMVKEFDEAAFAAEMNAVTEPVKTQFGYHLIKVVDKKEAGVKDFEEVKPQILQQMAQQRQDEEYVKKVEELKKKYRVEE